MAPCSQLPASLPHSPLPGDAQWLNHVLIIKTTHEMSTVEYWNGGNGEGAEVDLPSAGNEGASSAQS